jgi:hypothetical protein
MVAALVAVILLLREVLLPFVAGMVLAYLLDPLAARMERLGMSRLSPGSRGRCRASSARRPGDLIGSGASQEKAIVGETPNFAARLQGVAEPNSVVIAQSTWKLVGNLFELQDLGALHYNFCETPAKKPRRAPYCGANSPMPLPLRSS